MLNNEMPNIFGLHLTLRFKIFLSCVYIYYINIFLCFYH